jgi:hypothetical protein
MALTSSVDVVVKIFESFRNFFGEVAAHPPTDALKQYVQVDQTIGKNHPNFRKVAKTIAKPEKAQ